MPVCLISNRSYHDPRPDPRWRCSETSAEFQDHSSNCINIGLINNMADTALVATERQYLGLLDAASEDIQVHLSLYSLPNVPRTEAGARHVDNFYVSAENLLNTHLDGLIVTGREPLAPTLSQEPYWSSFTTILEWARTNTHSAIWSCLAAHAALLHMDGIERIRSNEKHYGVFECDQLSDHLLTSGAPLRFALPHSRWNGVPEKALRSSGYQVLTRAADAGVDTFVKDQGSMFLFFQGHPEYESNTLMLEYRRDVGRFLRGETKTYPSMPRSYFDQDTVNALTAIREKALSDPKEELLSEVSTILVCTNIENTWQATAACIYKNWLKYICAQKEKQLERSRFSVQLRDINALSPVLSSTEDASV